MDTNKFITADLNDKDETGTGLEIGDTEPAGHSKKTLPRITYYSKKKKFSGKFVSHIAQSYIKLSGITGVWV